MSRSEGFILKDYLISLIIVMMLFPIVINGVNLILDLDYYDEFIQDEMAILKLRDKMISVKIIEVNTDNVIFETKDKNWKLNYDGNRLYLGPGYQLYLDDIEDLNFYIKDSLLYVSYYKNNQNYEKYLSII